VRRAPLRSGPAPAAAATACGDPRVPIPGRPPTVGCAPGQPAPEPAASTRPPWHSGRAHSANGQAGVPIVHRFSAGSEEAIAVRMLCRRPLATATADDQPRKQSRAATRNAAMRNAIGHHLLQIPFVGFPANVGRRPLSRTVASATRRSAPRRPGGSPRLSPRRP
jgi:hypothetical protein